MIDFAMPLGCPWSAAMGWTDRRRGAGIAGRLDRIAPASTP
jgi:hypothetical protein